MKRIIDTMMAEDYSFGRKKGQLSFSCTMIESEVAFGQTMQGSFTVIADKKLKPEGYVYSPDLRMQVAKSSFGGLNMEIFFQYDTHGLEEGSICEGAFIIVSNLGEYELPYRITISRNLPDTSMGVIRNLFHYTNLAKDNWQEAVDLFYSPGFINILDGGERRYRSVYRGMSVCPGNQQNVENFLEVVKKKVRPTYMTDVTSVEMEAPGETIMNKIHVVRDGWGYTNLHIYTEGDFLAVGKVQALEEDFLGNVFQLYYYIHPDRLHYGKNVGAVVIEQLYDTIRIPVIVHRQGHARASEDNAERRQMVHLMHLYMDFRTGRITKHEWVKECHSIVNRMVSRDTNNIETRLYQIQLLLTEKRYTEADKILERVGVLMQNQDVSPELVGYYYYMKSLRSRDEDMLKDLADQTEYLYVQNNHSWRLAWLLMYMKEEYVSDDVMKWELIKQQYDYGNASPVLFLEALHVLLQRPVLLSELGEFELAFITFVVRQKAITREIRTRFVFLVSKMKNFSEELFRLLCSCYELEGKSDTLQEICALLIKGNKMGKEYFPWYALAVEQEIRLTRLYEYYMMSIDLSYEGHLPKMILMYFAYRSNLDYERTAFLYSNILKHKRDYQDVFHEYYSLICNFVKEQLIKGRINDNLAYLYEHMPEIIMEDSELTTAYLKLLFMAEIIVERDKIKYVVIVNEHLNDEILYPIYQKKAVVPIIGNESTLLLEDDEGNRIADDNLFQYRLLLQKPDHLEELMERAEMHLDIALYRAEEAGDGVPANEGNEQILAWLSSEEAITEEYRIKLLIKLAEYYFENDMVAPLDNILTGFEPQKLTGEQRDTCIHIMVARGFYDRALEWVRTFGTESVNDRTLLRLCDRILVRTDFEYEAELLKICDEIFKRSIYDETTLEYLLTYKEGSLPELKELLRAADSFDMDDHKLLENIIVQMLYTDTYMDESQNIFKEYISKGSSAEIEKVFLSKLSFDYFIKDKVLEDRLIDRIGYLYQTGEHLSIVCRLAYLKKKAEEAERGNLTGEEGGYASDFIKQLWNKQIFFPMFLKYKDYFSKLGIMDDRCYIEYKGTEGSRVVLHYSVEREDGEEKEYRKEEMIHMYGGIYVKSFILFYGEKIQYYITEEDGRQEKLTRSSTLIRDEISPESQNDRFHLINNMIISQDVQDYQTYGKLSEEYTRKNYVIERLFVPDFKF